VAASDLGARVNTPDVLVLGGGGLLGEVWMNAVLAGIEESDGFDARESASFIGTSAGSIVATALAAGVRPRSRLTHAGAELPSTGAPPAGRRSPVAQLLGGLGPLGASAAAPFAALALSSGATVAAGALLRRALLARVPAGRRSLDELARALEELDVRWDGRLQIAAVEAESGRRVMFGAPRSPRVSVSQAVQASCAIPGVFRPLRAAGRTYVDGGVWSPTNMDTAAVARGTRVLCLNPTGSLRPSVQAPAAALGAVSRSIAAVEALALRRRGASVAIVNPDERSRRAMGLDFFDPGRRADVTAAGLAQGRGLAGR
jgi:NTE family protein